MHLILHSIERIVEDLPYEIELMINIQKKWWIELLQSMLRASCVDMNNLESVLDKDSEWKDLTLLMEAADHHRFIQHAYHESVHGETHDDF